MANPDHYRKLESIFLSSPINAIYDARITVSEGASELVIPVRKTLFNAGGVLHGSVYFKALDDAAYFSIASKVEDFFVVTASFHTELLLPVTAEGEIRAVGKVVRVGSQLSFADSILYNEDGREIARGTGVFTKTTLPLPPHPGHSN